MVVCCKGGCNARFEGYYVRGHIIWYPALQTNGSKYTHNVHIVPKAVAEVTELWGNIYLR